MKARGAMNKEIRDATDKARQVCGRRRDGEAAVSWVSAQCLETLVDVAYTGCRPTERRARPLGRIKATARLYRSGVCAVAVESFMNKCGLAWAGQTGSKLTEWSAQYSSGVDMRRKASP